MKKEPTFRHFAIAFLIALIGYAVVYYAIEHRRNRKGPWLVQFTNSPGGDPVLLINHPALHLRNVSLAFRGELLPSTNYSREWNFAVPQPVPFEVPFGKCLFMDTTFLPGTLTFQLYGHEIELLPRVMIIDHEERGWQSDSLILLEPLRTNSLQKVGEPAQRK